MLLPCSWKYWRAILIAVSFASVPLVEKMVYCSGSGVSAASCSASSTWTVLAGQPVGFWTIADICSRIASTTSGWL